MLLESYGILKVKYQLAVTQVIGSEDLPRFSQPLVLFISFNFCFTKMNWWCDKCHFSVLSERGKELKVK